MFYYKFDEVVDDVGRYTFVEDNDVDAIEKVYHTLDGKNCIVSTEKEVDISIQPENIKLTKIDEATFKSLRETTLEWPNEWSQVKILRDEEMSKKTTEVSDITIDIDETAMNRIQRGITLANAQFNLLLAQGKTPQEAANVFQTQIEWKTSDNKFHQFTILEAIEALKNGISIQSEVWKKYG